MKNETLSHKFKIDCKDERFDNIKYRTTKRTEQPFCSEKLQERLDIEGMFFDGEYWLTKKW